MKEKSLDQELTQVDQNPLKLKFLDNIINDSYAYFFLVNSFCVFNSVDGLLCVIYPTKNKTIISYNINTNKKLNEIRNAHNQYISNIIHYLDKSKKRDLFISISSKDNNIILWNFNNLECLYNFKRVNRIGRIISACFFNDSNTNSNYLLTSNSNHPDEAEEIKIFDYEGNKIKEIKGTDENTFYITTFYDKKTSTNYIITGNFGFIKSYNFDKEQLYKRYDENDKKRHYSLIVIEIDNIIKIIDSSCDGNIRIWNFHTGDLLDKIYIIDNIILSICLWSEEYLFAGCMDTTIKLVDIKKGIIINELTGYDNMVNCVKKITHEKYGECLITQGTGSEPIKLWIIDN